jgi:hypothetical protein
LSWLLPFLGAITDDEILDAADGDGFDLEERVSAALPVSAQLPAATPTPSAAPAMENASARLSVTDRRATAGLGRADTVSTALTSARP